MNTYQPHTDPAAVSNMCSCPFPGDTKRGSINGICTGFFNQSCINLAVWCLNSSQENGNDSCQTWRSSAVLSSIKSDEGFAVFKRSIGVTGGDGGAG